MRSVAVKFLLFVFCILPHFGFAGDEDVVVVPAPQAYEEDVVVVPASKANPQRISTGEHVGGPIMSYILGFGLGHVLQGTWAERGKKFTIMDSVAAAFVIHGLSRCKLFHGCEDGSGSFLLGAGVLAVSRVWAIVDTIYYPYQHNRKIDELEKSTQFYFDPANQQLGLVYRF
jgi:hypothetical protein